MWGGDSSHAASSGGRSEAARDVDTYRPALVTRAMWQAKPPLPGMTAQEPASIVLHHSGVRSNPGPSVEQKMRGLQSFSQRPVHRARGRTDASWPDVPYHFYLASSGRIAEGRDVRFAGDTNTGYDTTGHIQIALEGDFDTEAPTPEQMEALRTLLVWLTLAWTLDASRISTHKDHAATVCPGRNFMTALPNLLARVSVQRAAAVADLCRTSPSDAATRRVCGLN
jgi:hypothetical protein